MPALMSGQKNFSAGNARNQDEATKNITQVIKQYSDLMGQRNKLQVDLLLNQLETKNNWIYKMKEMQAKQDIEANSPWQKKLGAQFDAQNQGGAQPDQGTSGVSTGDVFSQPVQPQVQMGEKGFQVHNPSPKEFIYSMIQKKQQRGLPLTPKEQKFQDEYLGTSKGEPTDWDIRKEARSTVNSILQNNPTLQMQAMKDPSLLDNMISQEVTKIKSGLSGASKGQALPDKVAIESKYKTTSEAVQGIMSEFGISKEEAIKHLQSLYQ